MPPESVHVGPTEDCPHPEWWTARDAAASEEEAGDFLYGLVRILKPRHVLETGCYLGDTSQKIVEALIKNGHGQLWTCDTNENYVQSVRKRLLDYSWSHPFEVRQMDGDMLAAERRYDLSFIDSGGDRLAECRTLETHSPGSYAVLHDARWKGWADIRTRGWTEIFFPTPRGISLFKVNHGIQGT